MLDHILTKTVSHTSLSTRNHQNLLSMLDQKESKSKLNHPDFKLLNIQDIKLLPKNAMISPTVTSVVKAVVDTVASV